MIKTSEILNEYGYRITKGRVALINFLISSKKPLTIDEIQKAMIHKIDRVTLYRALTDFTKSKIVTKINLQNSKVYYEFISKIHHHHHIICESCGRIEDIENCNQDNLQNKIIKSSKNFKIINSHSLEFFGICNNCFKTKSY